MLYEVITVMSWRGFDGGVAAAQSKHKVIMTPGEFCYFDHYQGEPDTEPLSIGGYTSVAKVYQFDPVPATLKADERRITSYNVCYTKLLRFL